MSLTGSRSVWNRRQSSTKRSGTTGDYITHETLTLHVVESPSLNAFLKSQKVNGEDATIGVEQVV